EELTRSSRRLASCVGLKLILPTVLGHPLSPSLIRNFHGRIVGIRQIGDAANPQTGFAESRTQQYAAIRIPRSRFGRRSLATLTTLSGLSRGIDNAAVSICRKRPLTALTSLISLAKNEPAKRKQQHRTCSKPDHRFTHAIPP